MHLPVTAGAYQLDCNCNYGIDTGFAVRIAADGKSLVWATYLGTDSYSSGLTIAVADACGTAPKALGLDSGDNVFVAGATCGAFPVSAGALQTTRPGKGKPIADGFVAKLASNGKSLLSATYLGGQAGSTIAGAAVDSAGNVWVAGTTASADFPSTSTTPSLGNDFVVGLSADFTSAPHIYRIPTRSVAAPPAFEPAGNLVLLAASGVALRIAPAGAFGGSAIFAISNAAALQSQAGLGAAELSTILGAGLGPANGAAATPDASGVFPTQLAGVQVLIDGNPAPLLYAGANQINFQATNFLSAIPPVQAHTLAVVTPSGTLGPYPLSNVPGVGVFRNFTTGGPSR